MPISDRSSSSVSPVPSHDSGNAGRRTLLATSLSRTIGFGLLVLFGLDLLQIAASYRFFDRQSDAELCLQVIERSGVLLVAYALVFLPTGRHPSLLSRVAMKVLSWGALLVTLAFLALAGLSALSAIRIYQHNVTTYNQEFIAREDLLKRMEARLPTLSPQQAALILADLAPSTRSRIATMPAESVVGELRTLVPTMHAEAENTRRDKQSRAKREQTIFGAKYLVAGLVVAALFVLIFENTQEARIRVLFENRRSGPSLRVEDAITSWVGRTYASAERSLDFSFPDLSRYRWFRRLRRKFRGSSDKK